MALMKLCLVFLAVTLTCSEAYKILVLFPMPVKSHGILGDGIVRHLLKDKHEVTYITPFPYKSTSPNVRVVDVSSNQAAVSEDLINLQKIMNKKINMQDFINMFPLLMGLTRITIENENVQNLLNNPEEEFDLVIAEWLFGNLPAAFATFYNCPLIWASSVDVHWAVLRLIDQPTNPAYTGDVMSASIPPFNFYERALELFKQIIVLVLRYVYIDGVEQIEYESLIVPIIEKRGRQAPAFNDIVFNASLLLTNSHVSLSQATPIPQNVKAVGGYHIEDEVKPLPEDLKGIIDNAQNGVIYFRMGSNLKSKDVPTELKEDILKVFGELKQTVLWKFEEELPNTPKNVHILKWAPQQSILSHPNTVVFITHGGLLSTIETIHFGVPIIGIPVFADQFVNVARAVKRGYAQKVDLSLTMASDLKLAIEELTTNPIYAQTAKELSVIYHDRTVSPGQELVHWVKHVIKTRGALHLRSPALQVPLYQKLYLDLLAVVLLILFVIIRLLKLACGLRWPNPNVLSKRKTN